MSQLYFCILIKLNKHEKTKNIFYKIIISYGLCDYIDLCMISFILSILLIANIKFFCDKRYISLLLIYLLFIDKNTSNKY